MKTVGDTTLVLKTPDGTKTYEVESGWWYYIQLGTPLIAVISSEVRMLPSEVLIPQNGAWQDMTLQVYKVLYDSIAISTAPLVIYNAGAKTWFSTYLRLKRELDPQ